MYFFRIKTLFIQVHIYLIFIKIIFIGTVFIYYSVWTRLVDKRIFWGYYAVLIMIIVTSWLFMCLSFKTGNKRVKKFNFKLILTY